VLGNQALKGLNAVYCGFILPLLKEELKVILTTSHTSLNQVIDEVKVELGAVKVGNFSCLIKASHISFIGTSEKTCHSVIPQTVLSASQL
jgi:hypothetical protein